MNKVGAIIERLRLQKSAVFGSMMMGWNHGPRKGDDNS